MKRVEAIRSWNLWGVELFDGGMNEVMNIVKKVLRDKSGKKPFWVATVNPEFVMQAEGDSDFKKTLEKTDLNVMDGVGLLWAGKKGRENLVPGVELMGKMVELAAKNGYKVFLLGGWGDRAERTAKYFRSKILDLRCQIGWSQGEPATSNVVVLEKINKFKPDILLVAYGMRKQEEWIERHFDKLSVKIVMGVGRSFDYYSGDLKRAPKWVRNLGMEWFYSLIREPKRWRRQLALVRFGFRILLKA